MFLLTAILGACSVFTPEPAWKKAVEGDGPGSLSLINAETMHVRNLPKSRSGNRSEYEVFGQRYAVLNSAKGFTQTGVASWYGSKFHGRATASGEIYDMHRLTAAHKHLPLPTFVRVTRTDNNQSIVVKVNDRGPFVGDRIIDLSFAAAAALDMLDSGKASVIVESLSHHEPDHREIAVPERDIAVPDLITKQAAEFQFVQVGAFGEQGNAQAMAQRVDDEVGFEVRIDFESARQLYLVLVGPLQNESALDDALQRLAASGIHGHKAQKNRTLTR